MTSYVALLHSIVLGAGRRIAMADLRRIAEEAGFTDPRTLVATGNLVIETAEALPVATIEKRLEQGIFDSFGKHIDVIVLAGSAWLQLAASNPFPAESDCDGSRVVVRAMRSQLEEDVRQRLEPYCAYAERLAVVSGHLWVSFGGKPSETRLLGQLTTRRLGVGTLRNWNTVKGLASMLSGEQQILYSRPETH